MGGGVVDIGTREHEIFDHLPKPKVSHAREVRATGSPTFPPSGRKTRGSAGANTGASQVARADGGVVVTWSVVARPDLAPQWGDEPLSPGLCVPSPPKRRPQNGSSQCWGDRRAASGCQWPPAWQVPFPAGSSCALLQYHPMTGCSGPSFQFFGVRLSRFVDIVHSTPLRLPSKLRYATLATHAS